MVTNPSLEDYAVPAGEQVGAYRSDELCQGAGLPMVLQLWIRDCPGLVASQQAALAALAVRFTSRRNFGVASLYTTSIGGQLLIPGLTLPEAEMLTLGVAGQFVLLQNRDRHQQLRVSGLSQLEAWVLRSLLRLQSGSVIPAVTAEGLTP